MAMNYNSLMQKVVIIINNLDNVYFIKKYDMYMMNLTLWCRNKILQWSYKTELVYGVLIIY